MLDTDTILEFSIGSLLLIMQGSLPSIIAAAVVGVLIALVQALTQIQDQGLPTAFKFFAVMLTLFITYSSISSSLANFSIEIFRVAEGI